MKLLSALVLFLTVVAQQTATAQPTFSVPPTSFSTTVTQPPTTGSPTTKPPTPTNAPSSQSPTPLPTTGSPTTASPTPLPTTTSPTTTSPTPQPTTLSPTPHPTTLSPTRAPSTTLAPTASTLPPGVLPNSTLNTTTASPSVTLAPTTLVATCGLPATTTGPQARGTCVLYNGACARVVGHVVWLPEGARLEDVENRVNATLGTWNAIAPRAAADPACAAASFDLVCELALFPCMTLPATDLAPSAAGVPILPCRSACTSFWGACAHAVNGTALFNPTPIALFPSTTPTTPTTTAPTRSPTLRSEVPVVPVNTSTLVPPGTGGGASNGTMMPTSAPSTSTVGVNVTMVQLPMCGPDSPVMSVSTSALVDAVGGRSLSLLLPTWPAGYVGAPIFPETAANYTLADNTTMATVQCYHAPLNANESVVVATGGNFGNATGPVVVVGASTPSTTTTGNNANAGLAVVVPCGAFPTVVVNATRDGTPAPTFKAPQGSSGAGTRRAPVRGLLGTSIAAALLLLASNAWGT